MLSVERHNVYCANIYLTKLLVYLFCLFIIIDDVGVYAFLLFSRTFGTKKST